MKFLPLILMTLIPSAFAEDLDLGKLFKEADKDGTIIIMSKDGRVRHVWNEIRSRTRYTPASTFKIPNTLIALEAGIGKGHVFKWDGTKHFRPEWNRDQTLESAFRLSCVWTYQSLAKQIGNQIYLKDLARMNYGNAKTGNEITTFWLEGDLKISAEEQIKFIKGLYSEDFLFSSESYRNLKDIMIVEQNEHYVLRAKTGWTLRKEEKIRWYVGYLEAKGNVWFFAANIDMPKWQNRLIEDQIVMKALRLKKIIK